MITQSIEEATLNITDIGVTLRTLLGCAAEGYKSNPKRVWKIRYCDTVIGSVRLKTNNLKGVLNERPPATKAPSKTITRKTLVLAKDPLPVATESVDTVNHVAAIT